MAWGYTIGLLDIQCTFERLAVDFQCVRVKIIFKLICVLHAFCDGYWLVIYCAILQEMNTNQHIWRTWVDIIHRWGLQNLLASLIEGLGPLTIIGAQILYIGKPVLDGVVPGDHIQALSELLEDGDQAARFAVYLREGRLT